MSDWSHDTLTNMEAYYTAEYRASRSDNQTKIITGIWFDVITNNWRVSMVYGDESIIRFCQDYNECLVFQKEQYDTFMCN